LKKVSAFSCQFAYNPLANLKPQLKALEYRIIPAAFYSDFRFQRFWKLSSSWTTLWK